MVRFQIAGLLLPLLTVTLASCRVTSQSVADTQKAQAFERLEVIYTAHPATGSLFTSVPNSQKSMVVQTAATTDQDAPNPSMSWSKAELRIECPHPDGRPDVARVTVHYRPVECGHECEFRSWVMGMEERVGLRSSRRAALRERWLYDEHHHRDGEVYSELTLPKHELDQILVELNAHGFFAEQQRGQVSGHESQLEVRLNRRWTSKVWSYEPTLDALITRVHEEGVQRTVSGQPMETPDNDQHTSLMPFGHSR
jgi:hypothetical protein